MILAFNRTFGTHTYHAGKYYDITVDIMGCQSIKIKLVWDYENEKVHLSIKKYLTHALTKCWHIQPNKPHDLPYPHTPPKYRMQMQYVGYDESPLLNKDKQKFIQVMNGLFLWYA